MAIGRRIGFYRLGKELGAGNFSKVKIGSHCLTNGNFDSYKLVSLIRVRGLPHSQKGYGMREEGRMNKDERKRVREEEECHRSI